MLSFDVLQNSLAVRISIKKLHNNTSNQETLKRFEVSSRKMWKVPLSDLSAQICDGRFALERMVG